MVAFLFRDRDGQTQLPVDLQKGLRFKHIQTVGELDEIEEANIAAGLAWLTRQKHDGSTHDFWLNLHKHLFGDVWTWAGKIRTHDLQNDEFHAAHAIRGGLRLLEGDLSFWLNDSTMPSAELTARFHERLETIHPFPNGNGRWGRILTDYLAKYHGFKAPTWGAVLSSDAHARRKTYIKSLSTARRHGAYTALTDFIFS